MEGAGSKQRKRRRNDDEDLVQDSYGGAKGGFGKEERQKEMKKKQKEAEKNKEMVEDAFDQGKYASFKKGDMENSLADESTFATTFPKYREAYLKEAWPAVTQMLATYGLSCTLDLVEGVMIVRTTSKTWDPFIIIKAKDFIKLLSRGVSLEPASKVMGDDSWCEIMKIGGFVRSKDTFAKRRQRLVGPDGSTLKAIEILTKCYVNVQGKTVAIIGKPQGIKEVRKIVEDCFKNIHPIYNIKTLMIKRELAKDEKMKTQAWEKFIPQFNKTKKKSKQKKKVIKEKSGEIFPPEQTPRKVDLQLETGEFFLSEKQRKVNKMKDVKEKASQKKEEKRAEKDKIFEAPKEVERETNKKSSLPSAEEVVSKIAAAQNKKRKPDSTASDFVLKKKSKQ